jgi:hypothetical protein
MNNTNEKLELTNLIDFLSPSLQEFKFGNIKFKSFDLNTGDLLFGDGVSKRYVFNLRKISCQAGGGLTDSDASTLAGLSDIKNRNQKGGNLYSDSSDVHKTFIKSSKSMNKRVNQEFSTTSSVMVGGNNYNSVTSSIMPGMIGGGNDPSDKFSATSELKQLGGGFSDTSSYYPSRLKNAIFSDASFGPMAGGAYSTTSDMQEMNGGGCPCSETSSVDPRLFRGGANNFSDTSSFNPRMMMGGGDSDTIGSLSEIMDRKNKKTGLDLNIFSKQNGGGEKESKLKLKNMGIHSSSTSSLCE